MNRIHVQQSYQWYSTELKSSQPYQDIYNFIIKYCKIEKKFIILISISKINNKNNKKIKKK